MRLRMMIFLLCLLGSASLAQAQDTAAAVPANLNVPVGNTLALTLEADGVQVYRCQESAKTAGTYEWTFVEPHADLLNAANQRIGIHFAGPLWQANDGSTVKGAVVEKADSPDKAIQWLLLKAVSVTGNGLFSHVSYVQRINTSDGLAPQADSCASAQNGLMSRIPYHAQYRFFTADSMGQNPLNIPENLQVPAGNQLAYQVHAQGVQIYRCQESADSKGTFAWSLVAPDADLMNDANERVGFHYAGPTWESKDGSWVSAKVVEKADSPDGAVSWLLLQSVSAQGDGTMGRVSFIQRLDTMGGLAPAADTCAAGQDKATMRVPYSALYVFYSAE